ncbi:17043_t:CDS:1 [Gigaspora margarita]|uniref:17043_t:CDS:1 n=1 Tax=Gigaspora margarita TaxID=4874 RepID=A0ABN7VC13_GIGMA|nr:17043_t:CDS:1 [Gigaspora margarita]
MTDSPRTSIGYDDTYSQVISQSNYYEDVTHNQTPQASDAVPMPIDIQEPSEKPLNVELSSNINFPTHVKIYRTINTFKLLALLLYIVLWIYQIIYNAINISINPSFETSLKNGTMNNGTSPALPYPLIDYNPSASYGGAIIMTLVFTLSVVFLVIEFAYLFITFRQHFIKKSHIIVSLLIFFIYLAFALSFNIIAGLGVLNTDVYSAMVTLLWIIPILSLLECFAGISEWPIIGVITIGSLIKLIKVILIFLYLIIFIIKLVRFNPEHNSYFKNSLIIFIVGILNLVFEIFLFIFHRFQFLKSGLSLVKRVIFMLFFTLYFSTAYANCYLLENLIYSIADGLIWVIALCCFVEFSISEIEFKKIIDDSSFEDNSQA